MKGSGEGQVEVHYAEGRRDRADKRRTLTELYPLGRHYLKSRGELWKE